MATTADGMLERRHPHRAAASSFPRIVGLDGLRAVAVIAVLGYHLWPAVLPGGYVGVTLFFALSGFLITSMLLHEQEQSLSAYQVLAVIGDLSVLTAAHEAAP